MSKSEFLRFVSNGIPSGYRALTDAQRRRVWAVALEALQGIGHTEVEPCIMDLRDRLTATLGSVLREMRPDLFADAERVRITVTGVAGVACHAANQKMETALDDL